MWEGANGVANRVVLVDLSGDPVAPGGGGGGGDATAANQVTQTAHLSSISTTQGAKADAPAASDTGTASEIAIAKRHNVLLSESLVRLSDIAAASNRWDLMSLLDTDEPTPGTTYLMYGPSAAGVGLLWGVKRVVTTGSNTAMRYAGPTNNPAQASASAAWAARATLVYGLPQEA